MKKSIYLVFTGAFGDEGGLFGAFNFKKNIMPFLKEIKMRYNKFLDLWENYDTCRWVRIDKTTLSD